MSDVQRSPFIPAWLDELGLPQSWFRVYCHLCRRGECHSSADTIASACRMKRLTVFEALTGLEHAGLILRKARPGRTTLIEPLTPGNPVPLGHRVNTDPVPDSERVPVPLGHRVNGDPSPQRERVPVPDSGRVPVPLGHHEGISPEGSPRKGEEVAPFPVEAVAELTPAARVQAELAKVFPNAPAHMTGAEQHDLFDALRTLDELTAEDWQAIAGWFRAPDRIRGRKLWPRDRAEFIRNAGQAIENIRKWWKTGGGRAWATRPEVASRPPKSSQVAENDGDRIELGADALDFFRSIDPKAAPPAAPSTSNARVLRAGHRHATETPL
jgi:hypothetical protein